MRDIFKVLLVLVAALTAGCESRDPRDVQRSQLHINRDFLADARLYSIGYIEVYTFTLPDGMRCVAVDDNGITCDWSHKDPGVER